MKITAAIAVVSLLGAPVAFAQTAPTESVPPLASASSVQPRASDSSAPTPEQARELNWDIIELQKTIIELRDEVSQEPRYLDQSGSPITGS